MSTYYVLMRTARMKRSRLYAGVRGGFVRTTTKRVHAVEVPSDRIAEVLNRMAKGNPGWTFKATPTGH